MFLFRPSKQERKGIPFPPPSKGLTPSPSMHQVLQEVHALLAGPSFHQHQLFANQRAQDTGFPVTDPAFNTSTEPRETAGVLSHTPAFSGASVSPGSYGVWRAWRLIALSPLPTAPWLPTSRTDVLLCIMLVLRILLTSYITGECTQLPFAESSRASPIQSTSINRNKDHLISRRQLVSLEVRVLC